MVRRVIYLMFWGFVFLYTSCQIRSRSIIPITRKSKRMAVQSPNRDLNLLAKTPDALYPDKTKSFSNDSLTKAHLLYNMAYFYSHRNKNNFAISYLQKALNYIPKQNNHYLPANIYKTWATIKEKNHAYKAALPLYKLYCKQLNLILQKKQDKTIYNTPIKENNRPFRDKTKFSTNKQFSVLFLFILLVSPLVGAICFIYSKYKRNKNRLQEAEQKIYLIEKNAYCLKKEENPEHNIILRYFDILKKAALLKGQLKKEEIATGKNLLYKFNEIVYGEKQLDWDVLYQTLNKLYNNFFDQIRNKYPELNESEFRICCLLYAEFDNPEIAIILNYSINTIQTKKSSIRKKLGIKAFGNIRDFLEISLKSQF